MADELRMELVLYLWDVNESHLFCLCIYFMSSSGKRLSQNVSCGKCLKSLQRTLIVLSKFNGEFDAIVPNVYVT